MTDGTFTLVDARGRKYLTRAERERFLTAARAHPRPGVQTLARTLAMTGCRVSEALGIRACDVDLEAGELRIANLKRRTDHWRAVPVPEDRARPRARASAETAPGERAGRDPAPLAHHPANGEPPGGRDHANGRHRGPASVPPGPTPQLRRRRSYRRRLAPHDRGRPRTRLAHDNRDLHHRDRGRGPRPREPRVGVG